MDFRLWLDLRATGIDPYPRLDDNGSQATDHEPRLRPQRCRQQHLAPGVMSTSDCQANWNLSSWGKRGFYNTVSSCLFFFPAVIASMGDSIDTFPFNRPITTPLGAAGPARLRRLSNSAYIDRVWLVKSWALRSPAGKNLCLTELAARWHAPGRPNGAWRRPCLCRIPCRPSCRRHCPAVGQSSRVGFRCLAHAARCLPWESSPSSHFCPPPSPQSNQQTQLVKLGLMPQIDFPRGVQLRNRATGGAHLPRTMVASPMRISCPPAFRGVSHRHGRPSAARTRRHRGAQWEGRNNGVGRESASVHP